LRQSQQQQQQQTSNECNCGRLLQRARRLLEQAFAIRRRHLGVWHVDTVETYNKLASVHLHLGELQQACDAYQQVFAVRRAVFGCQHPSVAIAAHALANAYYKMRLAKESLRWYQTALKIYEQMQLSYQHPTVAKLLKDRSRILQQQHQPQGHLALNKTPPDQSVNAAHVELLESMLRPDNKYRRRGSPGNKENLP
jgi:tetratricopeptide (TPR) repeat protein